jgi:hypothetical protein
MAVLSSGRAGIGEAMIGQEPRKGEETGFEFTSHSAE